RCKTPDVRAPLPWTELLNTTRQDLAERLDLLDELAALAQVFDRRGTHPWRGFDPPDAHATDSDQIEADLRRIASSAGNLASAAAALACLVGPIAATRTNELELFAEALE